MDRRSVHPFWRAGDQCSGKKLRQHFLTVREGATHLTFDEEPVGERTQRTVSNLVFNYIPDYSSIEPIAPLRKKFVTVTPALERTLLLHVGKMMVPFEFGNAGNPLRAQRREREDAKRRPNDGPRCPRRGRHDGVQGRLWLDEMKPIQPGVLRRLHDARQSLRIGAKCEDALSREGNQI